MRKLGLSMLLALSMLALATPALAHDVPNDQGWHTHDGLTGAGAHHKPLVFMPTLFADAALGTYGTAASGGYVDCPNATDKSLLPSSGQSNSGVLVAGVCMNDLYLIHLRSGVGVPPGWDSVSFGSNTYWYRVTPRG